MFINGKLLGLLLIVTAGAACLIVWETDWELPWRLVLFRRLLRNSVMAVSSRMIPDLPYGPNAANRLEIFTPRWSGAARWPVAIVFHGGGWESGSREEMRERVCRRYLAQGFLVVNVDYRFGLLEATEDSERVVAWCFEAIPAYGGDMRRVVVTGESAGAHLALMAGLRSPRAVAAIVNFYGVSDLSRMGRMEVIESAAAGRSPGDIVQRFSPVHYAGRFVPVVSLHGTEDRNVPVEQTELLTRQVLATGGVAEQVLIDHGRHGFSERQLTTAYRAVFDFLRRAGVIR